MKLMTTLMILAMAATCAVAQTQTVSYGWKDGVGTVHGTSGNVGGYANVNDFSHTGDHSLYAYESPASGTPELWICWIHGLQDGDEIVVTFWSYDDTEGVSPSTRIWGHWSNDDYLDDNGSAGGNSAYSDGLGWFQHSHTWTFNADGGNHTGMMVQCRLYSAAENDEYWVDDIEVTCPDYAQVFFPDVVPVANDAATWGEVKNLFK